MNTYKLTNDVDAEAADAQRRRALWQRYFVGEPTADDLALVVDATAGENHNRKRLWRSPVGEAIWAGRHTTWDHCVLKPLLFVLGPYNLKAWKINSALIGIWNTLAGFPRLLVRHKNPYRALVESFKHSRDLHGYLWLENIAPAHIWKPSSVKPNAQPQPRASRKAGTSAGGNGWT